MSQAENEEKLEGRIMIIVVHQQLHGIHELP